MPRLPRPEPASRVSWPTELGWWRPTNHSSFDSPSQQLELTLECMRSQPVTINRLA
jgi:hypothetical protein